MIIAAESAFALGRPGEARRLATRAMTAAGGTLDALFAGMPRSSVWPSDPAEPPRPRRPCSATTATASRQAARSSKSAADEDRRRAAPGPLPATAAGIAAAATGPTTPGAATPGLWDDDPEVDLPIPGPAARSAAMLEAGRLAISSR